MLNYIKTAILVNATAKAFLVLAEEFLVRYDVDAYEKYVTNGVASYEKRLDAFVDRNTELWERVYGEPKDEEEGVTVEDFFKNLSNQ